jgi:N-acetylglutamate synthase-like GNAT family acetyltransferase
VKGSTTSAGPGLPCVIRMAAGHDAPAIQSLYRELVDDARIHVLPDQIAAFADSPASFLLVAEMEAAVCATALLTICADAMYGNQPFGVMENVVVTRQMRGRGLGKQLLAHVEQLAINRNCTKLMLLSGSHRHEAHAFFRQCGFAGDTKQAFVKYRSQFAAR